MRAADSIDYSSFNNGTITTASSTANSYESEGWYSSIAMRKY